MLLLRLQGPLTFFVIAYLIILVQLNLLYINVLCSLLWSMLVQFGSSILLRTSTHRSMFSFVLLVGLLVADGIHPLIVGVSPLMIVWRSWSGPLFTNVTFTFLFAKFMTFFTIEVLFPFLIIFIYPLFILSIFDLLPHQLTHIVIHFLLTVPFCGMWFLTIF